MGANCRKSVLRKPQNLVRFFWRALHIIFTHDSEVSIQVESWNALCSQCMAKAVGKMTKSTHGLCSAVGTMAYKAIKRLGCIKPHAQEPLDREWRSFQALIVSRIARRPAKIFRINTVPVKDSQVPSSSPQPSIPIPCCMSEVASKHATFVFLWLPDTKLLGFISFPQT